MSDLAHNQELGRDMSDEISEASEDAIETIKRTPTRKVHNAIGKISAWLHSQVFAPNRRTPKQTRRAPSNRTSESRRSKAFSAIMAFCMFTSSPEANASNKYPVNLRISKCCLNSTKRRPAGGAKWNRMEVSTSTRIWLAEIWWNSSANNKTLALMARQQRRTLKLPTTPHPRGCDAAPPKSEPWLGIFV
ncbi:hypothetical protein B0H11DRAFT_2078977 [Mycena galericulata]|nr:hypothetical protein B0H11DRAFT_2078977 [Mycena galericulata]